MRKLIVLAILLASIGTVAACPPPRKAAVVVQQAVVAQQVVAAVVTQAVLVPTYTAAYQPAAQVVQSDPALIAELKALRQEVANLRGNPAPSAPAADQPVTFATVVANKCASCHKADVADKLGGGFVLVETDGKLSPLSLPEKRHIQDRVVTKGNMPPAKTGVVLSAAEKASTAELFASK